MNAFLTQGFFPMISESAFYMWRTVFALAHIDGIVTDEEKKFMKETLEGKNFSLEQRSRLEADIQIAQDPVELYTKIDRQKHKDKFFQLAKTMVWIDGDYAEDERQMLERLKQMKSFNQNATKTEPLTVQVKDQESNDNDKAMKKGRFKTVMKSLKDMVVEY